MTDFRRNRISIGLPVYNGEAHIYRAISSLLQQSFGDFELIISDNASTDRTAGIVQEMMRTDSRIRYFRQPDNIGALGNFAFVLDRASSPYFMWAASDDHWHRDFLEENLAFLDANPDYAASISLVAFDDSDVDHEDVMGTFALRGSTEENLYEFILRPDCNSRFYGLHRTEAIRDAWRDETYWASDWAVVCRVLSHGKYHEIPRVLMWRSSRGQSSDSYLAIRRWRLGWLNTVFPMMRFSRFVLSLPKVGSRPRILARLAVINIALTQRMMRRLVRDWLDPRSRGSR